MEDWNIGIMGLSITYHLWSWIIQYFSHIIPSFHYSNVPPSLSFFRALFKNFLDLLSPLDEAGKHRNLPL